MNSWVARDYRCTCGKLIFKGTILEGFLEFKCRHCDQITVVEGILNKKNFHTIIVNNEYGIINISDSALDLLGYTKKELIGKEIEFIETKKKEVYRKIIEKIKTCGSILFKTKYRKSNNELISVNTKTIFLTQRGKEYALIIFNTNTLRADDGSNGFEYGDVTMHLDTLGNITFIEMNNRMRKKLKYAKEDMMQKNIFDFFVEEDKEKRIKNFQNAVKEEKSIRISNEILSKDGKKIGVNSYLIPYYDNFGTFCGFESSSWMSGK
ncbi:MAG: PAS domain-containing protein [Candidatus Paceibacterota bacterium]